MKNGDIVTFRYEPNVNTPGACEDALIFGIEFTGVIVKERLDDGVTFQGDRWCEVLWSGNQVTKCYKADLKVWPTNH